MDQIIELFLGLWQGMSTFVYSYPLLMSFVWIFGAILYYLKWERDDVDIQTPVLREYPLVSIIVPCYNESDHIIEVIEHLYGLDYPNTEIIAINDGSQDDTAEVLISLLSKYSKLRVIDFVKNQGKATGLNMAAVTAKGEYLVCIDGDSLLGHDAIDWMVQHFLEAPRLGAITGNPHVRNRSTILGRLQVGEFSAIVGLIKRAQSIYGRIFAVSGVVTAFRKSAVADVGFWSTNMITEDIDICWRLQVRHWNVIFEPKATSWILMPETLKGLWKQRVRWAQGGSEVLLQYFKIFKYKEQLRMWPIFLEYMTSIIWAYSVFLVTAFLIIGTLLGLPLDLAQLAINGSILSVVFMLQFLISFYMSSKYEKGLAKYYFWLIWYPIAYWMIIAATSVAGSIKAFRRKESKAIWDSPDRGI